MEIKLIVGLFLAFSCYCENVMAFSTPAFAVTRTMTTVKTTTSLAADSNAPIKASASLSGSSDFGSAMPEMSFDEKMIQSAEMYLGQIQDSFAEGVEPPEELQKLQTACTAFREEKEGKDSRELAVLIYELMIEVGMRYDVQPDGKMTMTNYNIKEGLDIPEVKEEFKYLYQYGMGLAQARIMDVDVLKKIVLERLIERTGLEPEKFDEWLGYA